jgi:hypothetical protein
MKTAALKMMLLSALASCAAFAQNSDFAILYSAKLLVGNQLLPSGRTDSAISISIGSQFNYAHQILDARAGGLYLEFPLLESGNGSGNTDIIFTPGARFRLSTQTRVSPYAALGVGVFSSGGTAFSGRTTSAAVDFGGGFDVRFTRLLSMRTELRDYVSGSRIGGFQGRNRPAFSVGIAFHF